MGRTGTASAPENGSYRGTPAGLPWVSRGREPAFGGCPRHALPATTGDSGLRSAAVPRAGGMGARTTRDLPVRLALPAPTARPFHSAHHVRLKEMPALGTPRPGSR